MNRFMKDNMHLDLLSQVESGSIPLAEFFSDSIIQHASRSPSMAPTGESYHAFSDPPKYTLCVIQPERLVVLRSVYLNLHPDIDDSLEATMLPTTARKFAYIGWMEGSFLLFMIKILIHILLQNQFFHF